MAAVAVTGSMSLPSASFVAVDSTTTRLRTWSNGTVADTSSITQPWPSIHSATGAEVGLVRVVSRTAPIRSTCNVNPEERATNSWHTFHGFAPGSPASYSAGRRCSVGSRSRVAHGAASARIARTAPSMLIPPTVTEVPIWAREMSIAASAPVTDTAGLAVPSSVTWGQAVYMVPHGTSTHWLVAGSVRMRHQMRTRL